MRKVNQRSSRNRLFDHIAKRFKDADKSQSDKRFEHKETVLEQLQLGELGNKSFVGQVDGNQGNISFVLILPVGQ